MKNITLNIQSKTKLCGSQINHFQWIKGHFKKSNELKKKKLGLNKWENSLYAYENKNNSDLFILLLNFQDNDFKDVHVGLALVVVSYASAYRFSIPCGYWSKM